MDTLTLIKHISGILQGFLGGLTSLTLLLNYDNEKEYIVFKMGYLAILYFVIWLNRDKAPVDLLIGSVLAILVAQYYWGK